MNGSNDPVSVTSVELGAFRAVIEASPIPFALNDDHQRITYLNPEFVRTFGYTRDDIPTLADWWPHAYPDPAYRAWVIAEWDARMEEAQRTGNAFEPIEIVIRARDGSPRNVIAYAAALGKELAATHLVVLYDVTKQRRAAEEQRVLREQLIEAQRLESLGRLAGGVAHDFNNMIGVIMGRAQMALKGMSPSDASHAHVVEIQDAARRSADLARQLLVYARRQVVRPHVVALNEVIEDAVRMLQLLVGESVTLTWAPGEDLWPVHIDPSQLDQILTNLCANARDAITDVGTVRIRTANVTVKDATLAARGGPATGDYTVIEVTDDGGGIEASVLPHVFEPFFTTKPTGLGSGLGLATVYGIARQNDGVVVVESIPGAGSTFKVFLPRHDGDAGRAGSQAESLATLRGKETLLLVEDEPAMLSVVAMMLEGMGYKVLQARSAVEALRLAERSDIDLLITDVVMPGMSGRDLAARLHAVRPGLRQIFMSGYPSENMPVHQVIATGAHFLAKPFTLGALARAVRAVLDEEA